MHTKEKKKIMILGLFGLIIVLYIGFGIYFTRHFFPRTTLEGRKVGGYTAERLKQKMTEEIHSYALQIKEREDKTEQIPGTAISLEPEWNGTIEQLIKEQAAFAWPVQIFLKHQQTGKTMVSYDETSLKEQLMALECMDEKKQKKPVNATFSAYDATKGFQLKPAVMGTKIDADKMLAAVTEAVEGLAESLSIEEAGAYINPKVLDDNEQLQAAIDTLNQYAKASITYQIGEHTHVLDAAEFGKWFKLNKKLQPVFNQELVEDYVDSLSKTYNTCYAAKKLKTSYGKEVTISNSHYGWKVDKDAEKSQIIADIKAGKPVTRDLHYSMTANSHGTNDYGDSYVEINLTAQHLFLYKDGKLVIETDFVSGNVARHNASPTGAFGIFGMRKNAVLRGDGYATPVSYWMPFAGNVGMHDATWRKRFGGTIYKTGGSHGCINLPLSAAKTIFEAVENNYPVLVYELPGTERPSEPTVDRAAEVQKLIDAIGTVTKDSGAAISKAEAAYGKLSGADKKRVKNYDLLVQARQAFDEISQKSSQQQDSEQKKEGQENKTPEDSE